jgi:hypothetical protein
MNDYIDIYKSYFGENTVYQLTDNYLQNLINNNKFDEALEYCYSNDYSSIFKCLYLLTEAKFPIQFVLDFEKNVFDKCGKVCKPNVTNNKMNLEIINLNISDEIREKYREKIDMISFIINCRGYSRHIYTKNKFYYYFLRNKYSDRIKDILREM